MLPRLRSASRACRRSTGSGIAPACSRQRASSRVAAGRTVVAYPVAVEANAAAGPRVIASATLLLAGAGDRGPGRRVASILEREFARERKAAVRTVFGDAYALGPEGHATPVAVAGVEGGALAHPALPPPGRHLRAPRGAFQRRRRQALARGEVKAEGDRRAGAEAIGREARVQGCRLAARCSA